MDTQIVILFSIVLLLTLSVFLFQNKTTKSKESFHVSNRKPVLEKVAEDVVEDIEDVAEDIIDDVKKTGEEIEEIVASGENSVTDPIVIHDTVRRDSKVDTTLEYTYLDEQCKKIHMENPFPVEKLDSYEAAPITPIVKYDNSKHCDQKNFDCLDKKHLRDIEKINNSEMFDDSELKPKPGVDSPYGFVFFPNKYWKQWHQRAPVCVPTSKCKVLPTYTSGAPVDVLDYTQIGSMMPKFSYAEEYDFEKDCATYEDK